MCLFVVIVELVEKQWFIALDMAQSICILFEDLLATLISDPGRCPADKRLQNVETTDTEYPGVQGPEYAFEVSVASIGIRS